MPKGWRWVLVLLVSALFAWRSEAVSAPRLWFGESSLNDLIVYKNGVKVPLELDEPSADMRLALGLEVRLNVASAAELESVPGIGPRTAERIVESRSSSGCFERSSALMRVRGIGPKTASKLAPYLGISGRQGRTCDVGRHG